MSNRSIVTTKRAIRLSQPIRFAFVFLLAWVFLGWLALGHSEAHAPAVESSPRSGETFAISPDRVTIRFGEPVNPAFSSISVYDSTGQRVDEDSPQADRNDQAVMWVQLEPIGKGTFTVAWSSLSAVDGSRSAGWFSFVNGSSSQAFVPSLDSQGNVSVGSTVVARWLTTAIMLLVVGMAMSQLFIPSANPAVKDDGSIDETARWLRLYLFITFGFLAAGIWWATAQAFSATDVLADTSSSTGAWDAFTSTWWGTLWFWRFGLVIGALVALVFAVRARKLKVPINVVALGLGIGALVTLALVSHAFSPSNIRTYAVVSQVAHLLASATIAGLIWHLAWCWFVQAHRDPGTFNSLLRTSNFRFRVLAFLAVSLAIETGLYGTYAQVNSIDGFGGQYGFALLLKVFLVAIAVAAGVIAWQWSRYGTRNSTRPLPVSIGLAGAAVIFAALLVIAAFLGSVEPARYGVAKTANENRSMAPSIASGETDIALTIAPGFVGPNTMTVKLGQGAALDAEIEVRTKFLGAPLGSLSAQAVLTPAGEYVVDETHLVMGIPGEWQVEVEVRQRSHETRTATFQFELVPQESAGPVLVEPESRSGGLLFALEMLLFGLALLAVGIWPSRLSGTARRAFLATALTLGGAAVLLALGSGGGRQLENPLPPTPGSINAGDSLYVENCLACHGTGGRGDGPDAPGLEPVPADLTVHVPVHEDGAIFDFVMDGIDGSAMPSFADEMSENDVWNLVNYLRTLE